MNTIELPQSYPALPLERWEDTKKTLHLFLQIVGKIRLALCPKANHWWHAPLYVSVRGLTTRPIPVDDMVFEIEFDFLHHVLSIKTSKGDHELLKLTDVSVSQFYRNVFNTLNKLGIDVQIKAKPYDIVSKLPFESNHTDKSYDAEYVGRYFNALVSINTVFEQFRAKFFGKSTPVQLYWHHFDLVVTRFSGKVAPEKDWPTNVEREAYSHEVVSFGFWPGEEVVREAAFYAYLYPEPDDLLNQKLAPAAASWNTDPGYAMAFLPYDSVRKSRNPSDDIMSFLESVYTAGCAVGGWDAGCFKKQA